MGTLRTRAGGSRLRAGNTVIPLCSVGLVGRACRGAVRRAGGSRLLGWVGRYSVSRGPERHPSPLGGSLGGEVGTEHVSESLPMLQWDAALCAHSPGREALGLLFPGKSCLACCTKTGHPTAATAVQE